MKRPFQFDFEKAVQAVAFLLRRERFHRMNYMRLLKILYIAERECLRDSGKALTGSRVVAMKRGPVLEEVYELIRSQHVETPRWAQFFQKENYELVLIPDRDPGVGRLSRFVTEKLEDVAQRHDHDDEFAMVDIAHQLKEWQMNDPGSSSKEIPLTDILDAIGRSDDLDRIVQGAHADALAREFFATEPQTNS